jgi:predicted permease
MPFYRVLLWLYPASFRHEYGGEMQAIFARRWRERSGRGRVALLASAFGDALRNAPAIHVDILRQDTRFALRSLMRAPGLGITVILVAALGIGATTTAFSIADHVLIRPLPFRDADQLVKVWQSPPGGGRLEASPAHFRDWQRARSFAAIAAYDPNQANLVGGGEPLRLDGARVSGELFPLLGVPPLIGRTLGRDDDLETAPAAVVISERLWRARFGGDATAIGMTVILNDLPYTIAGVMPARFGFPSRDADYWMTYRFAPAEYVYDNPSLDVLARLKPGATREQAEGEVRQFMAEGHRLGTINKRFTARVIGLRDEIAPQSKLLLWCLLGAAGGVLLIACTNLANLLLTRGLARQKELAVRAALGAGRHRLLRQMLTESLLLAVAGGAAGVVIAKLGLPTVARLVPTNLPIAEAPSLDLRLLAVAMLLTAASAIAFGLLPAARIARQADAGVLRTGARGGVSRATERLRSLLVVAQVSASVVLIVASGLLLRAMLQIEAVDPGFTSRNVLTLRTRLPMPKYDRVVDRQRFFDQVVADVRALPGVSDAGFVTGLPMVVRGMIWRVRVPGQPDPREEERSASLRFVTPGFFAALGIPLRHGRIVVDSDSQATESVAVVSESFVRRYWPGEIGLGRTILIRGVTRTIVGVVGDIRVRGLERPSEPQMYFPSRQVEDGVLSGYAPRDFVVRSAAAPAALLPAIRAIIAKADPQLPVSDIQSLEEIVSGETAPRRIQVRVLGVFAAVAFLLAGIGLHGLLAYNVSQRLREIGIRLALGQERRSVLAMVMRHGLRLAAFGVVIGIALAIGAGRLLQALLAGTSPTDALTFIAAVTLALGMTLAGSLLPAVRAVRVNPIEVIRTE